MRIPKIQRKDVAREPTLRHSSPTTFPFFIREFLCFSISAMATSSLLPTTTTTTTTTSLPRHSFSKFNSLKSFLLRNKPLTLLPMASLPGQQQQQQQQQQQPQNDDVQSKQDKLQLRLQNEPQLELGTPSSSERQSFAVATGELFLGIASRLIPRRKDTIPADSEQGEERKYNGERIAKVMEDSIEPEVMWEQREKDVEAEKRRRVVTSPGFSFSAAGLLFPYHLGVAQFLMEKGYIKETTPLAGSSAGAIVCAVIASGRSMQDALQDTKILAEDCRLRGTAFRLGAVLRGILEKVLPDDVHIRCNGRVRVAVTQIVWRPRGLLIDQFDSKEDLINALFTSSFIPGYLAPRPATLFRNRLCVDGGLTLFMPPTSASQTVRVCAFPASTLRLQGIGISPDCNPESRLSTRQLFNWALEPADDAMLDKLFEWGYSDAAVWAENNPVDSTVKEDSPLEVDLSTP